MTLRAVDSNFFRTWSKEMAYVLGVIAADGCLVRHANGFHGLDITTKDHAWLCQIKKALGSSHKIGQKPRGYRLQIRNQTIYSDLIRIGLTPRKSKTLRFPKIERSYLPDFVRGDFDGDGTVWLWKDPRWRHPWQLKASFYSGSRIFLEELRSLLQRHANLSAGSLTTLPTAFELRYGIADGLKLYRWMYQYRPALCLQRKRARFEQFLALKKVEVERRNGKSRRIQSRRRLAHSGDARIQGTGTPMKHSGVPGIPRFGSAKILKAP